MISPTADSPAMSSTTPGASRLKLLGLALLTALLYFALFHYESTIIEVSRRGRWWFAVPVVIAFVFSLVHGAFTALFWDVLGVKARR